MPTEKPWPIEAYLAERLEAAIPKAGLMLPEGARIDVEVPREPEHGDWATPVALTLAKTARRPPRQVAETLRDVLVKEIERDVVSSIEIAGAGFINFRLAPAWLTANLTRILENPGVYGSSPVGRGEKILIEYVSANPTGPLNVVNARAASIGDALIRILNAAGYEARGEFYANDWGLQAELFGASIETRFQERLGLPASPLPEEGYAGAYVAEVARTVPEQDGRSWLGLPERERRLRFAGWGIDRMLERQKVDLDRFGARMDRWFRESELHRGGAVEKARARLGERGMTETRDGALWFRSTEFG
ncbi:MAG: arginine--tRNA ligase [Candidatus Eisenbacteria bacterium]|uniref:Arginine--tRNA ligase n=1 Tax=Eiseniibacteriota bacterium TaxID=2212470 RepID=A0A538SDD3_UNCEI|nr:MAG: arginine--tRNA ligase [Candidatus Eisenbacteria bacterium]